MENRRQSPRRLHTGEGDHHVDENLGDLHGFVTITSDLYPSAAFIETMKTAFEVGRDIAEIND